MCSSDLPLPWLFFMCKRRDYVVPPAPPWIAWGPAEQTQEGV